jgi:AraC family transcriptional regulator
MPSDRASRERHFPAGRIGYSLLPPHNPTSFTSTSSAYAFGVSFTGHQAVVIELAHGKRETRSFGPGTIGFNGLFPLRWLRVSEPSESLEVQPSEALLEEIANLTRCQLSRLDDYRQVDRDDVVWATCVALRASIGSLDNAEAERCIRNLALHVAVSHLDGRVPRDFRGRLGRKRIARVSEFLDENNDRYVPLAELASIAAMSPYHFHRSFRQTTGLTPGAFAMAKRMERAHRLLALGISAKEAAAQVGIRDGSYFRRCYRRFFKALPPQI